MSTSTLSGPAAGATQNAHDGDGPGGFGRLVLAEWTKFRTIKGWVIAMIVAGMLTVALGVLTARGQSIDCQMNGGPLKTGKACLPYVAHGPGGEVVTDSFYFVRQPLTGNGTITARITSLTGSHANFSNGPAQAGSGNNMVPGLDAWSKAGIIIKDGTHQGSAYAAMMVTGANGVRMQYNYTQDTAGMPGNVSAAHPRWLRLVRAGDTITGYDSADGVHWTQVGVATLSGLPSTVQIGLFATSPHYEVTSSSFGGGTRGQGGPSDATGVFDHVQLSGRTGGAWKGTAVGGGSPQNMGTNGPAGGSAPGGTPFTRNGGTITVSGSGDIAPVVPGDATMLPTATIEQAFVGVFLGLIVIVVVGAMFFTVEYRRGLIRTTFAATPRRGSVLAAKAIVAGLAAFVVGIVACLVCLAIALPMITNAGNVLLPASVLTDIRVVAGTAAMLGVAAALAVAVGAVFRRSAAAITAVIVAVVLPFLLLALNVFPPAVGDWLLRLTPAAGLAIEQSVPRYAQVATSYSVNGGYYPMPPWAGFAVLCCWAAAALGLAVFVLRRRDA